MNLRLDWCSFEAARYACEHWHYSKCVPHQKTVKIGVWEESVFRGAVIFGDGANNGMFKPYGLDYSQGCELVRVALRDHAAPVSKIVSLALRFLKVHCPKIRLVLSFADPEHGHVGTIYQAGNWVYTGVTKSADEYLVNNVRMHGRALRSTRSTHPKGGIPAKNVMEWARKVIDPCIQTVSGSSKYRYLMPLDPEMRAKVLPLAKPYPKRVGSDTIDTAAVQAAKGGVIPTPTLQTV